RAGAEALGRGAGLLLVVGGADGDGIPLAVVQPRIGLGEHEFGATAEEVEDIAHVSGVFEVRPAARRPSNAGIIPAQNLLPGFGRLGDGGGYSGDVLGAGETAVARKSV